MGVPYVSTDKAVIIAKKVAKQSPSSKVNYNEITNKPLLNGSVLQGNRNLTKNDVGLNNVNNTSDADKPISNAVQTALTSITKKIPSEASENNKLADKNWVEANSGRINSISINNTPLSIQNKNVDLKYETSLSNDSSNTATVTAIRDYVNSSISASAANYVTSDALGDNFSSTDRLFSGPYYYNGQLYELKNNDYAIVAQDEYHGNLQARYLFVKPELSAGSWSYQYTIGSPFTSAQQAAIDSGINVSKVAKIDSNATDISNIKSTYSTKSETASAIVNYHDVSKQDILTPGNNISISNNVISAIIPPCVIGKSFTTQVAVGYMPKGYQIRETDTIADILYTILYNKPKIPVTGVEINTQSVDISTNDTYQLQATVVPQDATNKNVSWSTSNNNIVSVNEFGLITGKAKGNALITVKTEDGGFTAYCVVNVSDVPIRVSGVSLDRSTLSLTKSQTSQLVATVSPDDAADKTVSWSSSSPLVASVNSSGLVTGLASGKAIITVTTTDGGFKANCEVTVNDPTDADKWLIGSYDNMTKNIFISKTASELYSNASPVVGGSTTWSPSSSSQILYLLIRNDAAIENGKLVSGGLTTNWTSDDIKGLPTAESPWNCSGVNGHSDIQVNNKLYHVYAFRNSTWNIGSDVVTINVNLSPIPVSVTGVTLDKHELTINVNNTTNLVANVIPSDATNKNITWITSNSSVASVVEGVVKGLASGTATITVKTEDGNYTDSCLVTVNTPITEPNWYVGSMTNISASTFRLKTNEELLSNSQVVDNNSVTWSPKAASEIFYIMVKNPLTVSNGSMTSGGLTTNWTGADIMGLPTAESPWNCSGANGHSQVLIDNILYNVYGFRSTTWNIGSDRVVINL